MSMLWHRSMRAHQQINWMAVLLLLFMLALAFLPAWKAVAGLERGATIDLHRDEAFVQALLEGHYGQDPTYLGGGMWYTPLITWLEALLTAITGLPAAHLIVRLGPFANLLAPIAFFAMCRQLLGPVRAVAATAAYLFWAVGQEPGWVVATYSHRLIPVSFSQSLFYVELMLIDKAFRTGRQGPALVAGLGAGLTFLAHAAPAMIAVLMIGVLTGIQAVQARRNKDNRTLRLCLTSCLFAAIGFLLASMPLTWRLLMGGMHVANREGFLFTYYALTWQHIGVLLHHNLTWFMLFGTAGLVLMLRRSGKLGAPRRARTILLSWLILATCLFIYSYSISVLDKHMGINLPALLPTFHFYFYASAVLSIFAGLAFTALCQWAWSRVQLRHSPQREVPRADLVMAFFLLIATGCTLKYPSYATRRDVIAVRNRDLAFQADQPGAQAAAVIRREVPWNGVVLCDLDLSVWPMLCTARHVVATASTMGNPYLDQKQREQDNALLLEGLEQPRSDTGGLLAQYGVTHLLAQPAQLARMPLAARWFPHELFRNDKYVLLMR